MFMITSYVLCCC